MQANVPLQPVPEDRQTITWALLFPRKLKALAYDDYFAWPSMATAPLLRLRALLQL